MTEVDIRTTKTVDIAEPYEIRQKLLETGWVQANLYTADYWWFTINYKKVGVERKSLNGDFLTSLGDQLSGQLLKMLEHFDFSILLIEGHWKIIQDRIMSIRGIEQWYWSTIWNYLQTWQDKGITLQLTSNEGHTIRRLNELYSYYQKEAHAGGLKKSHVEDSRILALQCGGIGPKLGKLLLDKFGSIKNIANASMDDFMAIEKIGKAKAEALYDHFNINKSTGEIG